MLTVNKNELPNPHKDCIHKILNSLICQDNDLRQINAELRNLQGDFKLEMDRIQFNYEMETMRRPTCQGEKSAEKILSFTKQITTIDELNECFSKKMQDLKHGRDEIIKNARQQIYDLNSEKCKLKQFHETTVDYLKRYAIKSDDPIVISNCEKDICEMHKMFVKEVTYIKQCEAELQPFLHLCNLQDLCNCCCFKDYDWIPQGKSLDVVNENAAEIKNMMGTTITKAFAQFHIQQASNIKSYLSAYLMNLEHNEEVLREKLNIFGNSI